LETNYKLQISLLSYFFIKSPTNPLETRLILMDTAAGKLTLRNFT